MSHLNVEIKARCRDIDALRRILLDQNPRFAGTDRQTDTYFQVPKGRLKLREGRIENALIHYRRSDQAGPKRSEVALLQVAPDSPLKTVLHNALDTLVRVVKTREIYFIDNVKFHIDQVEGLGDFVEIEAIDRSGDLGEAHLRAQCDRFMTLLGIEAEDLLTHSYSDMLRHGL